MASGKESNTYNLTEIYRNKLHSPRDKAGNIYYITKEGATGLSADEVASANSKNWLSDTKTVCNSPTNIRRIWFGAKSIVVEYYAAPLRGLEANGEQKRGRLVEHRGTEVDIRLKAKELLKLMSLGEQASRAVKEGYMAHIEITGNPLASKGNYALNNIEEVYFDWTALCSKDTELVYAPLLKMGNGARMGVMQTYLNGGRMFGNGNGGIIESEVPLALFLGKIDGTVNRNYLRLRKVVMISHLQDIIDKYMSNNEVSKHVDTFDINNVKEASTSWMDRPEIVEAIRITQSDVLITNIGGTESANKKNRKQADGKEKLYFMIKNSTYVFDEKVLGPKIDKYTTKVDELIASKATATQDAKKAEEEAAKAAEDEARAIKDAEIAEQGPQPGSIYEHMENIKAQYGLDVAKKAFAAVSFSLKDNDVKTMLAAMPTDVQKMYNTARLNLKATLEAK